jgi:hypothetical protein
VDYAFERNGKNPIIVTGSSYSASLALWIATKSEKIKAVVLLFLKNVNVAEAIKSIKKPVFVTGAKKEMDEVSNVIRYIGPRYISLFKPKVAGFHGSKTLWESVKGSDTFWKPLSQFLLEMR